MRLARALATLAICVVLGAALALGAQRLAGGAGGGYLVRAIFDNASFVIPGEELKVAGVAAGTVRAVELTPQNKAAVVLQITNPQFRPFRTDARCEIGIESLLGEQFVQCTATQPLAAGASPAAPLPAIASGPDAGQHLLPLQNTTTPVGFDLLQDIARLPEQERLRLIITELGAGLDANGQELGAALRRADPALRQTDAVIAVLAGQDQLLARLTDESERVLAPLAVQRRHIGGFIRHGASVALAAGAQQAALEQDIRALPPFLRQLGPAARRLSGLAGQLTPALQTLATHAPAIDAAVQGLGPLAERSIPALRTLGTVAQRGEQVFPRVNQASRRLLALSTPLAPLAVEIAALARSFDDAGGIEDAMRFIYYYTGAVNGEDAQGHYIRSLVALKNLTRQSTVDPSNSAMFACVSARGCAAAAAARAGTDAGSTPARSPSTGISPARSPNTGSARMLLRYLLSP